MQVLRLIYHSLPKLLPEHHVKISNLLTSCPDLNIVLHILDSTLMCTHSESLNIQEYFSAQISSTTEMKDSRGTKRTIYSTHTFTSCQRKSRLQISLQSVDLRAMRCILDPVEVEAVTNGKKVATQTADMAWGHFAGLDKTGLGPFEHNRVLCWWLDSLINFRSFLSTRTDTAFQPVTFHPQELRIGPPFELKFSDAFFRSVTLLTIDEDLGEFTGLLNFSGHDYELNLPRLKRICVRLSSPAASTCGVSVNFLFKLVEKPNDELIP